MILLSVNVPLSTEKANVEALIDSGADVTVLPAELVHRLKSPRVGLVLIAGVGQEARAVTLYAAELSLEGVLTPEIHRVVAWEKDYALLGRDILNSLVVLLRGPERRLEFQT